MDLELKCKRVLVAGSSRGIGRAIAEKFLQEGAHVVIAARGEKALQAAEKSLSTSSKNKNLFSYTCDFASEESTSELRDLIIGKLGGLDIVIANVGSGKSVMDPLPDNSVWQETWQNNFVPAMTTARIFLPALLTSRGCILFISSIAGIEATGAPVDYSTAKSAVISLAKNMSKKVGNKVRVNVVAPGNVMFNGGDWAEKMVRERQKVSKFIALSVPMQRFGTPEEIANAVVFLSSDRASFITGTVLVVDGGQTAGF